MMKMLMGSGGGGGDDEKREEKLFKCWGTSSAHLAAIQPFHILAMAGHSFIVTDIAAAAATVFYFYLHTLIINIKNTACYSLTYVFT